MFIQKVDKETEQSVWEKGQAVGDKDASKYRKDQCGAWMRRNEYGDRKSIYGWEVDHINPNGPDTLLNYRPLQWENNVVTSDGRLTCPVRANGETNEHV